MMFFLCFFFSSRRRHTRWPRDWSSDVCSSDLWERRMDESQPVPPMVVEDGPVMENVLEGDEVDLFRFPAPLWHPRSEERREGKSVDLGGRSIIKKEKVTQTYM